MYCFVAKDECCGFLPFGFHRCRHKRFSLSHNSYPSHFAPRILPFPSPLRTTAVFYLRRLHRYGFYSPTLEKSFRFTCTLDCSSDFIQVVPICSWIRFSCFRLIAYLPIGLFLLFDLGCSYLPIGLYLLLDCIYIIAHFFAFYNWHFVKTLQLFFVQKVESWNLTQFFVYKRSKMWYNRFMVRKKWL